MHIKLETLLLSVLPLTVLASPARLTLRGEGSASITQLDNNPVARAQALAANRAGFQYAPSLMGNASYHLGGPLGEQRIAEDLRLWLIDRNIVNASLNLDVAAASAAVTANYGLRSVRDYETVLYNGQWDRAIPGGEAPGMLTNYTQDLLFSMERLSLNPFPLRRVKAVEPLPFTIPSAAAVKLTGYSLEAIKLAGRLFVVDHSYQAKYEKSERYGAATTALFFIHPKSGDFLPLAIKTNVGADLVYTPLDTSNDWLLAKMMFNVNDVLHSQMFHLAASHDVGEVVHEAALRTLSFDHPVMVILERLMYQAFAVRVYGDENLVQPGGPIDQAFYVNANGAREFVAEWYPIVGRYQANYLETFLKAQGLLNQSWGPSLKSFPFYADASPINAALRTFFTTFVNSYYSSDTAIAKDTELQSWFVESNGPAKVLDFPSKPTKKVLIEVLTHFAFLTGVSHHALNTGDPSATKAILPFHPASLYAPIPVTKNVTDLLPFLPPARAALYHIALFGAFSRAHFEQTNRTLAYMFSDESVLGRLNSQTRTAAGLFFNKMKSLSDAVRARKFDANGLSQGMPFVWRSLDPGTIPFFFAV